MKILLLLCCLPLSLWAGAPKKPLPSRYTVLYTSSPFTTPAPVINTNLPVANPLEDWVLGGVTKFPDGYFVILINKKKPDEKTVIQPGMHSEFQVIEVIEDEKDYTATTVKLRYGSSQGTVTFDKKLLTVNTPSQKQEQEQRQPQMPPGLPGTLTRGDRGNQVTPRPRTISPPIAPQIQVPQTEVPQGQVLPEQIQQNIPRR